MGMDTTHPPSIMEVPDWMVQNEPSSAPIQALSDTLHSIFLEHALPIIAGGVTLTDICKEYHTPIDPQRFRSWVLREPTRKQRWYDALAIGAEALEDEIVRIADAADTPEDVQRSTLRINTRKWLMGVRNRKRYGDIKQMDVNVSQQISITQALAEARGRVIDMPRTLLESSEEVE